MVTPLSTVDDTESKSSIQVIDRMMKLLNVLAQHPDSVSLKSLAQLTHLHPSSTHRILNVMAAKGWVDHTGPGAYRLGLKFVEFGNIVKSRLCVHQEALPFMRALHQDLSGETINLVCRQEDEIVYIERISNGRANMRVEQPIGARSPLHLTAAGKLFLARESDSACEEYANRTGLPAYTKRSIDDLQKLLKEIAQVRKQAYAFEVEEAEAHISSIAVGICNDQGELVAGLSVSTPSEQLNKAWVKDIRASALQISYALGYPKEAE